MLAAGIATTAYLLGEETQDAALRASWEARGSHLLLAERINGYLDTAVLAVAGAGAALHGSPDATATTWCDSCQAIVGPLAPPGLEGLSFVSRVKAADRAGFLEAGRRRARPDFAIRPGGDREEYRVVLLHFPGDQPGLMGLDLATLAAVAKAFDEARDTGRAAFSAPFHLPDDPLRRGFILCCLATYAAGAPVATQDDRRSALTGWVSALLVPADMVSLAGWGGKTMMLFAPGADGRPVSLFTQGDVFAHSTGETLSIRGQPWSFSVARPPLQRSYLIPGIVAGATLLLFLLVWSLGAIPRLVAARAEEATLPLMENLERVRGVLDSALDGILTIDDTGVVLSANAAVERIFGYAPGEIAGKKLTTILSEECREEYTPGLGTRFRVGHQDIVGRVVELSGLRQDGSRIPIDLSIWEVRVLGKRVFTGIVRDITERKRSEDALHEARFRLERALDELKTVQRELVQQERLRALGEMASGITHDFNNFLSPIAGFAETLLSVPGAIEDREKTRRYLELIHTSAKAAAGVVARLREFYRRREGGDAHGPIELNRLLREVVDLTEPKWRGMALAKGIEVRVEVLSDPSPTAIQGNEAEIRNVLTNLVFNAVDAMPRGGALTLSCARSEKEAVVEVRDTGTGMTEEVRRRCLEPFYTTKGERGTGLGLSVALGTVERHGGTIEIESEMGRGTTMRLRFPLGVAADAAGAEAAEAVGGRSARVLVAEDDGMIREMLSGYLSAAGHSVVLAKDGREAIETFRAGGFDLVVTDMAMPEMSGTQLAAEIRRAGSKVPVILLSGLGEQMRAEGADLGGIDLVLGKPVSLAALAQAVATLTSKEA